MTCYSATVVLDVLGSEQRCCLVFWPCEGLLTIEYLGILDTF